MFSASIRDKQCFRGNTWVSFYFKRSTPRIWHLMQTYCTTQKHFQECVLSTRPDHVRFFHGFFWSYEKHTGLKYFFLKRFDLVDSCLITGPFVVVASLRFVESLAPQFLSACTLNVFENNQRADFWDFAQEPSERFFSETSKLSNCTWRRSDTQILLDFKGNNE